MNEGVETLNRGIETLVANILRENKELGLDKNIEIVGLLEDPMFDSLEELHKRAWVAISDAFNSFNLKESCS